MFEAARRRLRSIAIIDVEPMKHPMHGPSAIGAGMSSLAYAELRARR